MPIEGLSVHVIDQRWLHFVDSCVIGLTVASSPFACVPEYMSWFRMVSFSYIGRADLGDRCNVVPRLRLRNPDANQLCSSSQEEHAHPIRFFIVICD